MKTLQVIVECNLDSSKEEEIKKLGKVKYKLPMINSYVLELPETSFQQLKNVSQIEAVHQITHITAQMYKERQSVKASAAYQQGLTGKGITIAILDTGIADVTDFVKPHNRILAFRDIVNGKSKPYDDNGHGTHVSGICIIHLNHNRITLRAL